MPPPVTSARDAEIIAAFGGLTGAIAQEVKDHPAFGTALMREIRAKLGPGEIQSLVAALGAEQRPFKPQVPFGDLRQAMREAPEWLGSKFVFENEHRIRNGYTQFEINPPQLGGDPTLEATHLEPNENGGITVKAGRGFDAFTGAAWHHDRKLSDFVTPAEAQTLREAGFNLDQPTSVLVLKNSAENDPVVLAFNPGAPWEKPQVACICSKVTVVTMDGRSDFVLEKPVVYFYPEQKTHLTVKVELDGEFIAEYPKSEAGIWSFIATPDGTLYEPK
jgi:hypothetical protein